MCLQKNKKSRNNMAGQIRITPEQMRARASEFRTEGANFQDVIGKMKNLIGVLQEEW